MFCPPDSVLDVVELGRVVSHHLDSKEKGPAVDAGPLPITRECPWPLRGDQYALGARPAPLLQSSRIATAARSRDVDASESDPGLRDAGRAEDCTGPSP